MKRLLMVMAVLLPLIGCDNFVEKHKYDAALKQLEETKGKLAQANERLAALEAEPKHHYSLQREGDRTFRFDSATGETCLKLASQADWKKKDTKRESCAYKDFLARPDSTFEAAECFFAGDCTLLHDRNENKAALATTKKRN